MDPTTHFPSGVSKDHRKQHSNAKRRRERERGRENIRHGGLESMQYSRSWSCSMGRWVMSAIDESFDTASEEGQRNGDEEAEKEEKKIEGLRTK